MKQERSAEEFQRMPVWKAVLKNAIPAMVAMLMVLIYNLADTFFIGQTHDAYQVAAVSLATPVFLLFMAVGTVFGIGGTSVISRAMGEGRKEYAKRVCSFCMWACVFVGAALSILFLVFMEPLLGLIGASADTWMLTKTYLSIVALCGPFVLISNCYSNILRAEGRVTQAMVGQVLGNLLNVVLDPLMILGFGWEIAGAAIATVIGNMAAAMYYIVFFLRGKSSLSIRWRDCTLGDGICVGVLSIGIPASLASVLMSVSQIIMNSLMADYGDMAVAGIGVAMKVSMITGLICMGIGQGVQPLLGFCVGAKTWERYQKLLRFSLLFAFGLGLCMTGLCTLFTSQIAGGFLTDPEALDYAVQFARILLTTGPLFGLFYVLSNALQAMGAAVSSLVVNLSRQGLIYLPALFVLRALMGVNGLVWAQPAADLLSLILAWMLYQISVRRAMKRSEKLTPEST